jgi:predicted Fe-S protein YdhL (DUF1289 family)
MAMFPKIQSPCPYKNQLASVMDGDMCRMCKRQVFDLSDMSAGERVAFLKGCTDKVCVSYKFPMRPVLAAAVAVAAVTAPMSAAACEPTEVPYEVVVGGINDPANVEYVQDAADSAIPELPVVYEDNGTGQGQAPAIRNTAGDTAI